MAGGFTVPQQSDSGGGKKRFQKKGVLSEPPALLLVDIAFNLLLFFVAIASTEPSNGLKQEIPKGDPSKSAAAAGQGMEVVLTKSTVSINGDPVPTQEFVPRIRKLLAGKAKPEERIVVIRSAKDTPYSHWIKYTSLIEQAGGIITLQLDEDREIRVK